MVKKLTIDYGLGKDKSLESFKKFTPEAKQSIILPNLGFSDNWQLNKSSKNMLSIFKAHMGIKSNGMDTDLLTCV